VLEFVKIAFPLPEKKMQMKKLAIPAFLKIPLQDFKASKG
jgi:hypothetical protein